jgi:demethoxyubiquinone hydroxylase (CLK1/Coq7/Cat5 family)
MSGCAHLFLESDGSYYSITSKISKYVPYLKGLKNVLTMHYGVHYTISDQANNISTNLKNMRDAYFKHIFQHITACTKKAISTSLPTPVQITMNAICRRIEKTED